MKVGDFPLPLLRYDGAMGGWLQFTEYDETLPSYRATFYVHSNGFCEEALCLKRAAKIREFRPAA